MNIDRKVVEQAIEALKKNNDGSMATYHLERALCAALAAPQEKVEPVAWRHDMGEENGGWEYFEDASCPTCQPLYTHPPQREPVAWTQRDKELLSGMIGVHLDHAKRCDGVANRVMAEKQKGWDMERVAVLQKALCFAPPQREPLTDGEVWRLYQTLWPFHPQGDIRRAGDILIFSRAIERAHGIGGDK